MISVDIQKKLKAGTGGHTLKLSIAIEQGSIVKIAGPSGSGKTTLLKIIAGLTKADSGKIIVGNETWLDSGSKMILSPQKRKAGFVFQNYALFPNMTVLQHLQYATTDEQWIKRLLQIGKLESFVNQKPDHLSGGQQQRLAILRAMATKPVLLLMDEPFSALDQKMKVELIADLKKLWKDLAITVFIVSHNPVELDYFEGKNIDVGTDG